eukprot:gene4814-6744_t
MSLTPGDFGKKFRCLCCNNPWNQVESDVTTSAVPICSPCLTDDKGYAGIDPQNFDNSKSLKENFYLWSNGGWMAKNPIPNEYPSWNTFLVLRDLNLDRLQSILNELSNTATSLGTTEEQNKLSSFYNAFMDVEAIEKSSNSLLRQILQVCQEGNINPTVTIGKLHAEYGINVLFSIHDTPDKSNSDHSLCSLYQSGLGLPDRDYYFDKDKEHKRKVYIEYISQLFSLLGSHGLVNEFNDKQVCDKLAYDVFKFELSLASSHLTRTAARDPELTFNKMNINKLKSITTPAFTWSSYLANGSSSSLNNNHNKPKFDWNLYFTTIGKSAHELGEINVAMIDAMKHFPTILNSSAFVPYLIFHTINNLAPHLQSTFVDTHFNLHEKELKGTSEQKPRWKRALGYLEDALGEELGKLYVKKYFPFEAKAKALVIVESVRDALRDRLKEVEWMSESTRQEALLKMEKFKVKIGFPDHWIDYSSMKINPALHLENWISSKKFHFQLVLSRMNAPTDKSRWFMTPQTVNAYYHPSLNEIVFPAAILQPPFFDSNADVAVQYGSLGAVVGHEMTHGFDDQGRKYDNIGNLRDWWAPGDGEEYERRANVMVNQAANFEVYGVKLNGKLTCGENIADLGGVKLALRALNNHLASLPSPSPLINGFTPHQRLFLAWSQSWRENCKKERALQLVTLDPHGPNELRCNGTLTNVQEFFEAFNIKEGDPMYRVEADRVDIW